MFDIILYEQTPKIPAMKNPETFGKENKPFLDKYMEYITNHPNALGLAANQVKHGTERIMKRFAAIKTTHGWVLAIDPKIIATDGGTFLANEGCLTWPNRTIAAKRYPAITVTYYDMDGEHQGRNVTDVLESQIWQHEINHLNGVEEKIVDGNFFTLRNAKPKIGRNDPCPCESGKKYKKCCINK